MPEPTNTSAWSAGSSNPIPKFILVGSVASSKIILSSASVPLASVPSIVILPGDTSGSIVEIVPVNSTTLPKVESNEAFAV